MPKQMTMSATYFDRVVGESLLKKGWVVTDRKQGTVYLAKPAKDKPKFKAKKKAAPQPEAKPDAKPTKGTNPTARKVLAGPRKGKARIKK